MVQRLERATAAHDWRAICKDLFTEAARERAGGDDCARLLGTAAAGVRRPAIEIRGIQLRKGGRARVELRTRAEDQEPASDALELRRERGEWRVEALVG